MIRIQKIRIHEFRGIRDLTLHLNGASFAACGPNGTGKSGIVDAIEFALTGNISRLAGSGTGGLSVKQHGPHVDSRNKPEQSFVELEVAIPSSNKIATIVRTVKDAGKPQITPADQDILAALEHVSLHPEFVLSRRELIQYVLSEPGKRSKEVQALLRLDDVEKLRALLHKIANACAKEVPAAERSRMETATLLKTVLNLDQMTAAAILKAANKQRSVLGLASLTALEATTSLKDGLSSTGGAAGAAKIPKAGAQADIGATMASFEAVSGEEAQADLKVALQGLVALKGDAALLDLSREALLKSAIDLFDDEQCPVCDTPWEPEEFRALMKKKIGAFDVAAAKRKSVEATLKPVVERIVSCQATVAVILPHAAKLNPPVSLPELTALAEKLREDAKKIELLLPLDAAIKAVEDFGKIGMPTAEIDAVNAGLAALPEPTAQDAARDLLVLAQERMENYRAASLKLRTAQSKADTTAKIYEVFGEVSTEALEAIYKKVEGEFIECYRRINSDDESAFTAKLTPSIGKLGFDVDFYGRGDFPPGAYHSEGHQDGMGLCLYLALMSDLLGKGFTFAVLDDVLMSVDAGHRREVCKLLTERFPSTQFVFTTHDDVWLRHMKSAGLIKGGQAVHFRTWSVETGPAEWDSDDVWADIQADLDKNNVPAAAGTLRRYLEYFSKEACDRLRAPVEFRGDNQFMLGDLLPNAISAFAKTIKKAKAASQSWNQAVRVEQLEEIEAEFDSAKAGTNVDQWQINAAVHYNQWANFQKQDFQPVVGAFRELTDRMACGICGEILRITPNRGPKEVLICSCSKMNFGLQEKPKS